MDYSDIISKGLDLHFTPDSTLDTPKIPTPGPIEESGITEQPKPMSGDDMMNNLEGALLSPDQNAQLQTKHFDWGNADRYVENPAYTTVGYDPFSAPVKVGNQTFDPNELRYSHMQTWSDVAYNSVVGGGKLFMDTFERQFESWGDIIRGIGALAAGAGTGHAWKDAQEAYLGTQEDLLKMNEEQQAIMNRYAIFQGENSNSVFSRDFVGNAIQQFGLGAGQTAEMLAEVALTMGAGSVIDAIRAPMIAARLAESARAAEMLLEAQKAGKVIEGGVEAGKNLQRSISEAQQLRGKMFTGAEQQARLQNLKNVALELQKVSDISANPPLVRDLWQSLSGVGKTLKNMTPGTGVLDIMSDTYKLSKATGESIPSTLTNWSAWKGGVGSLAKDLSMFNMASTHGKLLAFTTYGQQYSDLIQQYEKEHDGASPPQEELEKIKNNAWMAAKDVFNLNVPLIMLMGKIEWGGLFSKFSSAGRSMRALESGVEEGGERATFTVKGRYKAGATLEGEPVPESKVGQIGLKDYERSTSMFPAIRTFNMVRKDFGLGTALWQGAKVAGKSALLRFEVAEGMHLLLQTVSDQHYRDYYKNLYNGAVDINGKSFWDATNTGTWGKEMVDAFNNHESGQGFQTFIMGATGGVFMTPVHTLLATGRSRIMGKISPDYKNAEEYRKAMLAENLKIANGFYKDPVAVLNTHVDAIKATGKASENMSDGIQQGNRYTFTNAQNDLLAKTVSTFIKNGNYDSFLYTLRNAGNMSEKDFYEAAPNMKPVDHVEGTPLPSPKSVVDNIMEGITGYYNRWQALKDKYAGLIRPEYFQGRGEKALKMSEEKRNKALDALESEYGDIKYGDEHEKLSKEDQTKNYERYQEYQGKKNDITALFNKETEGNKYYQQLMRKRALDEAIEVAATMGHNANEAVKNMLKLQTRMMNTSEVGEGISKHGAKIINVLGDKKATVKEIANLNSLIKTLETDIPAGKDVVSKDIKRQLLAYKEQLEHLTNWQSAYNNEESHQKLTDEEKSKLAEMGKGLTDRTKNIGKLEDAYKGYIKALNNEIAEVPVDISTEQFYKSLDMLTQHINYRKDNGHYMDAMDVIADPRNFQKLYNRIYDGMSYAMFDRYLQQRALLKPDQDIQEAKTRKAEQQNQATEEAKKEEELKKTGEDRRIAEMQRMKLSELLPEVQRDIQRLEDQKNEIQERINDANAKLTPIESDLQAARDLLSEDVNKSEIRREFKRIEKSLRGKSDYLKNTIRRLTWEKEDIERSLNSLNVVKENYSRAMEELEKTGKPVETLQAETAEEFKGLPAELTKKYGGYKLDYAIEDTKNLLSLIDDRIKYLQQAVDTCEKAINDIFNLINFTDEESAAKRPYEEQVQALIRKFEGYTRALSEVKEMKEQAKGKYERLNQTKQAREGKDAINKRLEYLESIKDALQREPEEPEPDKPLPEAEPKKAETIKAKKEQKEKLKREAINVLDGKDVSEEVKRELKDNKDLQAIVDEAKNEIADVNEAPFEGVSDNEAHALKEAKIEEIKAKAEKDIQKVLDEQQESPDYSNIPGVPKIEYEQYGDPSLGLKWRIRFQGGTKRYKSKPEAISALNDFVNERYPKIEGTDFRKGQIVYNASGDPVTIQKVAGDKVTVQLVGNKGLSIISKDILNKFTEKKPTEENYSEVKEIERVEEERENPPLFERDGKITTNDPAKVNYDDINSIMPHATDEELKARDWESGRQRFLKFLVDNNITDLNDAKWHLKILPGRGKGTYNPTESPDIRVVRQPVSYGVNVTVGNKTHSIYLMPNGAGYEFQLWHDHWVKASELTEEQFFKFFNVPSAFYNDATISTSELYKQFKADIAKVEAFSLEMSKKKVGDEFKDSEVHDLVSMQLVPHLNYSGPDKLTGKTNPESIASDVTKWNGETKPFTITLADGTEGHSIIVNKGADFDKRPFVGGWGDASSLAESAMFSQAPIDRGSGMYAMLDQLPTGQQYWIQLKPAKLSSEELTGMLTKAGELMTGVKDRALTDEEAAQINAEADRRPNAEIEGGSKSVNDILNQIFIPFNVYRDPGKVDYSQKWSIRLRAVRAEEDTKVFKKGDWHITMMMEETFGPKDQRDSTRLVLPNVLFNSAKSFADSINSTLHETAKDGTPKHPEVAHLEVDPDNFRRQVFRDDINSVMQMATNLSVENGSVIKNMNVNWTFKGDADKILEDAQPQKTHEVYIGEPIEAKLPEIKEPAAPARVYNIDRAGEKTLKAFGYTKDAKGVWKDKAGKEIDPEEKLHIIETGSFSAEDTTPAQEELNMPTNNPQQKISNEDVSFDDLEDEANQQQRSRKAKKILGKDEKFDAVSLENIDKFTEWVGRNLPKGIISVENLGVLRDNLAEQNVTVGSFVSYMEGVNQVGKISLYENSPFKYHEAFHAVFRLLLPEQRIQELLNEAKKENPLTESKLQAFRDKGYVFDSSEVADRFAEEHLADRFQAWKQGRKEPNTVLGAFFRYISDLFKEMWAKITGNKVEGLFYEINRGKYRNARLQDNSFTGAEGVAITQPANKAIWVGTQTINGKDVDRFLPQQVADRLSASIAGMFLQKLEADPVYQKTGMYNKDTILNGIMDMYADMLNYNARKEFYENKSKQIADIDERNQWKRDLVDRYKVFRQFNADGSLNQSRQEMKESVDHYLRIMGLKQRLGEEQMEEDEVGYGALTTEKLERESAFSLGGFSSLPTLMRKFIGTTTFTLEELNQREGRNSYNEFYNTKFLNGEDIVQAVDANRVYNGMLKALANTSDVDTLMRKLMRFVDEGENPETGKFIEYIFNSTGFDPVVYKDSNGAISGTKNENIIQQVVKAFNQYTVNTKFIGYDSNSQSFKISDANTKDASFYQVTNWQNAFNEKFHNPYISKSPKEARSLVENSIKPLQALKGQLDLINSPITDAALRKASQNISMDLMSKLGINLHPAYIRYSVLKSKMKPDGQKQILTPDQLDFVNSYPLVSEVQSGPIANIIKQLQSEDNNIFVKDEKGAKTSYQSLTFMADGNAMFDENINMMSHKNAEGENVTNFVQPFYSAVAVTDMNKGMTEWMKGLPEEFQKEVANNPLLRDPSFLYMMDKGMLSVEFIDGMRATRGFEDKGEWVDTYENDKGEVVEGHWEDTGSKVRRDREKEGKVYADFSDRDFISALFSFYNVVGQSDVTMVKDGNVVYKIAVPIRVPAEKSMFALIKLPVIHTVIDDGKGGNKLTDRAFRILYNRIEEEFNSIRDVHRQIADGENVGHNAVENWNMTDTDRGTKFFQSAMMLGDLRSTLESNAKDGDFKLDEMKEDIRKQLNSYFLGKDGQVQKMISRMMREKMMDTYEGEYANEVYTDDGPRKGLLPDYLFEGFTAFSEAKGGYVANTKLNDELFLQKGNFRRNIAQVYMNSFLNTTMANNLLHGNESKLYKDMLDVIKRESGTMATGNSIEGVVAAPSMGITKALKEFYHVTYADEQSSRSLPSSSKPLEVDDGHGVCTDKGLLYMLYGKGTLNAVQASILNKLRKGGSVSSQEFFASGGLKSNGAFNSLKMVHNDGQVYLKFSITPLFKDMTSYRAKDGTWLPLPGKEELHDLRERLEKFESDHDTITIAHPQSSSKMMTRNVYKGMDGKLDFKNMHDSHFEKLQAKYFKEQLQNPSNKVEIVDPTQPKLQMPAEQELNTPIYYSGRFTKDNGKPLKTVGDMVEFFMENTAQRIANNFTTARDSIFNIEKVTKDIKESIQANKVTPELGKFLAVARENLEATGTDAQMLGFMDVDANGVPKYNINFPSLLPKITSIFFSYFSRGVLREKVPGMSLAIVSPARGLGTVIKQVKSIWTAKDIKKYNADPKLEGQPREWKVVPTKEFKANPAKYKDALRYNNRNDRRFNNLEKKLKAGEEVYILDDIRDNYLKFVNDKPMGYYSEALRPAHNEEEMKNGFSEADKYGFGTRIPYVDKNNATSFEYVDQLPVQMGSIMVVPREYYERTGADNDIDKDYVSTHDTYVKGKERVAYGTAETNEDKFKEYVQYQKAHNKDFKEKLQELKKLYNPKSTEITGDINDIDDSPLTEEELKDLFNLKSSDSLYKQALKELRLPSTVDEFMKTGGEKLNNGVLTNRALDAKIAMLNNESTVKNQNTPTTTDPLKQIVKELIPELSSGKSEFCKQVLDMMQEKNVDVNSILAMVNDRSATMTGADSISSVAVANVVYSFFNQMKRGLINQAITIDGHEFNSFEHTRAWDGKVYAGERIFAALGCLTNTMTDNPKERNANKLNLTKEATGFAAYLIATGMPEKTAYLYMIQPSTMKYMELKKGGVLQLEGESTSGKNYVSNRINELLKNGIEPKAGGLTTQDLIDNIKDGGTDEHVELSVLQDLQKMENQSETYFKVARVIRTIQGVKGGMEDFDKIISNLHDLGIIIENGQISKMSNEEFDKTGTCVDLRDALLNDHKFVSNTLHAIKQLDACMPSMFIERTELFRNMTQGAKASLVAPSQAEMDKFNRDIKYDLLSYISIRAYKHFLDNEEKNNSLNQSIIYSGQGYPTIVERANDIKKQLENATRRGVNNYLLSYFLVTGEASEKTGGINVLEANTWAQLSEMQQERLIASFVDLYQDAYKKYGIYTHDLANSMFNYLLVKDGGQFTNGSFIRMLPPFIFKDIMDKIGEANELMKGGRRSYEELFGKGVTQQSMLTDFMKGYTTHVANRRFILKVERPASKFEPSRAEEGHAAAFAALSKEDKILVAKHNSLKGGSIIFQKNQELTVNALGGIRSYDDNKTGKFDAAEKVMLMDNKEHLDQIGFNKSKSGIIFPMSFQYNNRLYSLQEVYKMDEAEGKWKPVMTDVFIAAGEYAPTGLKAKYVEHKWEGSTKQFPAASAAGPVPEYKPTEKEVKKIAKDTKNLTDAMIRGRMVKEGYREVPQEVGKGPTGSPIMAMRVVDKDGKLVVDDNNKPFGRLEKAYEFMQGQKGGKSAEAKVTSQEQQQQPAERWSKMRWQQEFSELNSGETFAGVDVDKMNTPENREKINKEISALRDKGASDEEIFKALKCIPKK